MSKKRVYIPVNFTVAPDTILAINNCTVIRRDVDDAITMNVFLNHFKGEVVLEDCEIWVDEDPVMFLDKIEYYFQKEEERLLL